MLLWQNQCVVAVLAARYIWQPHTPSPHKQDCEGSCGSATHCCDYGFFSDADLNATRVSIPHSSGALDGYLMVNSTAPYAGAPPLTILYSHGSGWNVAVQYRILRYKFLLSQGSCSRLPTRVDCCTSPRLLRFTGNVHPDIRLCRVWRLPW